MALTQAQLDALNGKTSLTPDQSATVLGHSTGVMSKLINGAENLLPTVGGIVGGLGGAAAGGAAGVETGPGLLGTAYLGGVAGAGAGAAAGEALKEKLQGQQLQPGEIAKQGGINAAFDAIGGPLFRAGGKLLEGTAKPIISTIGKGVSKVADMFGAKGATKIAEKTGLKSTQDQITARALSPKLTTGEIRKAGSEGKGIVPKFGAPKIDYSKDPGFSKMIEATKGIVKGKSAITDVNSVKAALSKEAASLESKVAQAEKTMKISDIHTTPARLSEKLDSLEEPISLRGTPFEKQVGPLKDALKSMVTKNGITPSGLLKSRKEFDALVEKTWPNLYESESAPMRTAVTGMRNSMNDFIEENLPKGAGYKESLTLQRQYYNAIDNISTKIPDEIKGGSTFGGRHPILKKTGKVIGTGAAIGAGISVEQEAKGLLGL